jgi:hypothetical protein
MDPPLLVVAPSRAAKYVVPYSSSNAAEHRPDCDSGYQCSHLIDSKDRHEQLLNYEQQSSKHSANES